ncbi:MAG: hypothetical protein MUP14_02405 [Dehalococcoidia bacterium]|nr:hypothetical protein [Dehalococcoidia bacterium]
MSHPVNVFVPVDGRGLEKALATFKNYTKGSDFMAECKAHLFFMSKSERRRIAKAKGRARARKRAARQGN